jgi:hypothetical protein
MPDLTELDPTFKKAAQRGFEFRDEIDVAA